MPNTRKIITSPEKIRAEILRNIESAVRRKFPIDAGKYRVELKNIRTQRRDFSQAQQKNLLLTKGNASEAVYVDFDIINKDNGSVVHSMKDHRLVNVPHYTNRYTMMVDGNEYSIANQMRTKSGVYTRKRSNEELESSFNLARGANFKLVMDPSTGMFKIHMLGSTLPMYAVLKILGAPDGEIRQALGADLFATNENVTQNQMDRTRSTLYTKLAKRGSGLGDQASNAEKEQKIREYFSNTQLDPETTKITLGQSFSKVNYQSVLEAAKKILRVYNDQEKTDERDNLEFQQVYSVEDIMAEVLDKNREAVNKIATKLKSFNPSGNEEEDRKQLKSIFSPAYFTKPIRNFITGSSLSRLPSQINPMEMIDSAATITRLGEGAISSETAVPDASRDVNYSYMGLIDPIATPESSKVGIENRVTMSALKGDDNEFYKEVRNLGNNKIEQHRAIDLYDRKVGMPDPIHNRDKLKPEDEVGAVHKGELIKVKREELDFQIPSPHDLNTVTTSTIPFVNANQANRLVMGDKHVQQALPLAEPETRLVRSTMTEGGIDSTLRRIGDFLEPKAPVDGKVTRVTDEFVYIKDTDGNSHKVEYEHNMPLASKTMLHNTLHVKQGDNVKKGQSLGDSNFTKDGDLAVGKTMNVGYMPYKGLNHEDGVVVSESGARKMTSVHSDRITTRLDKTRIADKSKFTSMFPTKFSREQLNKLDDNGVIKKGEMLNYGDPVALVLEDNSSGRVNQVLGQLHRSLRTPYKDVSEVYDQYSPAEVLESMQRGNLISVMLKTHKPLERGDKMAGSYGNKGVVTKILPDDEMPQDADGNPLDTIFSSVGVISRINPAQTLESALGKVAKKTGKKYDVENFSYPDYVDFVKKELDKHGIKDKETVTDPITGKKIPNVFVGQQYMHKMFKTTDSNFAARGIDGPYDQDDVPTGAGKTGPKGLGGMEVNALIGHNARGFMRDASALRSAKNSDFWNSFKFGQVAHPPTEKRTFDRFVNTLKQAGVNVNKQGDEFVAGPLTDYDVERMSSGEIRDAKRLSAKDLSAEPGGLFDEVITGGMGGTRWGHIDLQEPVISPVFKDATRHLLGMTGKDLERMYEEEGGDAIKQKLNQIDVDSELSRLDSTLADPKVKGTELDKQVKKYKYLQALKNNKLSPGDAYMLKKAPVTPPSLRPITVSKSGDLMENDANLLYRDLILQNNSYKDLLDSGIASEDDKKVNRKALNDRMTELSGFMSPQNPQLKGKGVKGAASFIAGDVPKEGYFQDKVIYSKLNTSGRATLVPDNTLDLDEVGLPEDAAWDMYKPFLIRRMTQMGHSSYDAKEQAENRSELAKSMLMEEMDNRPVVVNRAPTLWRHSILGAKPKLRSGKNLHVNTLWEKATNQDYDGDAANIHVPVSDEAVEDTFNMLPSKQLFSDKKPGDLLMQPTQEPIVGLYQATQNLGTPTAGKGPAKKFQTEAEAWNAYHTGDLKMTDKVSIGG